MDFLENHLSFPPRNIPQKYTRETFGIFLKIIWHFFPKFLCHSLPKEMAECFWIEIDPPSLSFGKTQKNSSNLVGACFPKIAYIGRLRKANHSIKLSCIEPCMHDKLNGIRTPWEVTPKMPSNIHIFISSILLVYFVLNIV